MSDPALARKGFLTSALSGSGDLDIGPLVAEFYARLVASGFLISSGGVITLTQAPVVPATGLTGITNAQIAAGAAIARSKLDFGSGLVNADLAAAAAIARSKLDFGSGLVNADIAAAAAITYTKLALSLSVVDADIAVAAAIAWSKISKSGSSLADLTTRSASDLTTGVLGATLGGSRVLLYANTGTNAAAGATTVDSIALSGLTAKDTLVVEVTIDSVTQQTARPVLYHVTDAANLLDVHSSAGALPAGATTAVRCTLRQRQSGNTLIAGYTLGLDGAGGAITNTAAWNRYTATAAWTGSWTLGLRHGGVTAGGTFQYSWAVYKVAGQ